MDDSKDRISIDPYRDRSSFEMSKYNRVAQDDPEAEDGSSQEFGGRYRRQKGGLWEWVGKRDGKSTTYMLVAIILLLSANLVLTANSLRSTHVSRPHGHGQAPEESLSPGSRYKSAEAAAYFATHEHPEDIEGHAHEHSEKACPSAGNASPVASGTTIMIPANITTENVVKRDSAYTPALNAIEYVDADLEYNYEGSNAYRGPPTDEREKAWYDLFYHPPVFVPSQGMSLLNRTNLDAFEKADPKKGDGYLAWSDMHRQLGCLAMIRQYTYFIEGAYTPDKVPGEMRVPPQELRKRMDHCIEAIRLSIVCHGDMTPSLVLKERNPAGWQNDFSGHFKCRNFTKLQEWTVEHAAVEWGPEQGHHNPLNGSWDMPPF